MADCVTRCMSRCHESHVTAVCLWWDSRTAINTQMIGHSAIGSHHYSSGFQTCCGPFLIMRAYHIIVMITEACDGRVSRHKQSEDARDTWLCDPTSLSSHRPAPPKAKVSAARPGPVFMRIYFLRDIFVFWATEIRQSKAQKSPWYDRDLVVSLSLLWILASDWSPQITWPQHWPLIGWPWPPVYLHSAPMISYFLLVVAA